GAAAAEPPSGPGIDRGFGARGPPGSRRRDPAAAQGRLPALVLARPRPRALGAAARRGRSAGGGRAPRPAGRGAVTLRELLEDSEVLGASGSTDVAITGLGYDSRRIRPGEVFFALAGQRADGRAFLERALGAGAAAAVVERGAGRPAVPQPI